MAFKSQDERIIMIMAEPENGDGYVYATSDPQRAIEQLAEWTAKFGPACLRCNEGFEALARPMMASKPTSDI